MLAWTCCFYCLFFVFFGIVSSVDQPQPQAQGLLLSPFSLICDAMTTNATRLPTAFISHGGGPSFFIDGKGGPMADIDMHSEAKKSLERLPKQLRAEKPDAIVLVTAHWEGNGEVLVSGKDEYTKLYYDYGGFPSFTYELQYRAPAQPKLAAQIVQLLTNKGIPAKLDKKRDWDHGVFIPLKVMYPNADIPVVALSILSSYDAAAHINIGKALEPLRDQNILVLGSGFATHNFDPRSASANVPFTSAVTEAIAKPQEEREKIFASWTSLPMARLAHAQEDHFLPLHVVIGAAGSDAGKAVYSQVNGRMAFVHWGFGV